MQDQGCSPYAIITPVGTRHPVVALTLALLVGLSSCGGGDEGETANPREVEAAVSTIANQCIDISFQRLTNPDVSTNKVSLAVDDLIRNFNADPDGDLGKLDIKANTPREAMESSTSFLEDCSPSDAERVHDALASTPASSKSEAATTTTASGSALDEQKVTGVVEGLQRAARSRDFTGACAYLSSRLQAGLNFGSGCTAKYVGLGWLAKSTVQAVTINGTKATVDMTGGSLVLRNENGEWRIDLLHPQF